MDDEFAELYGSAADEPVQKPTQPAANGALTAHNLAAAPAQNDDYDDLYGQDFEILIDDDVGPAPPVPAKQPTAANAAALHQQQMAKPPAVVGGGRVSSTHLQYVRPELQTQGSMGSAAFNPHAANLLNPQMSGAFAQGLAAAQQQGPAQLPGASSLDQRQGSLLSAPYPGPQPPPGAPPAAQRFLGSPMMPAAAPGVAPGGEPMQLGFIPMGAAGFQHNVEKEEYKEFLNLGHGEIFSLDLDRVTTAPWRAAGADISDFFNYGLTERTWRMYVKRIERFRAAYNVRNKIEVLIPDGGEDDLAGLPKEIVMAVRQYRMMHPNSDGAAAVASQHQHTAMRSRGREYKRTPDESVIITLLQADAANNSAEQHQDDAANSRSGADGTGPADAKPSTSAAKQQQQQKQQQRGYGGDYDGPLAFDMQLSGIPNLPPDTIAPLSPKASQQLGDAGGVNALHLEVQKQLRFHLPRTASEYRGRVACNALLRRQQPGVLA
eukprot:gene5207-5445_t